MLVDTIFYSGFILVSLAAKRNSRKRGDIEYQNSPIMECVSAPTRFLAQPQK